MPRFSWDRERPIKEPSGNSHKPGAYTIRKNERGDRISTLKQKASISNLRRKAPITLAGQHWNNADEP
jgi:hypothetical protein